MLCIPNLKSQSPTNTPLVIEDLIEEMAHSLEEDVDYSQLTADLYFFLEHPLNINQASEETLERLCFLNDFQIKSLLSYIELNGALSTLYELQLIEGFDAGTIKKLLPFVSISPQPKREGWQVKKALQYGNHTLFGRISGLIETPQGFKKVPDSVFNAHRNSYYPGNRMHGYSRYKFNYKNKLQWGVTAEKDAGEAFLNGAQSKGFDFYSAHFQINDVGSIKTAVLGDFQVQFAQGLILWSYMTQGKSSYVMDIRKRGSGLNKYSSSDENAYFRGGGLCLEKNGIRFTAFGSYKKIDATLHNTDTLHAEPYFTALQNTGIHALPSQIENQDAVREWVYGANLNWQYKRFKMGVSGVHYQFDTPFIPADSPKNKFRFSGLSSSNVSTDMEFRFKALHFFSEAALSENGGKAILAGALMELSSQVRTSVLYRNYEKEYQALYSNAFSEGSRAQNEQGFYLGMEMLPLKKWKIAAYYDFYKFPWLTQSADAPSKGNDLLMQIDYTLSSQFSMYARFKKESKEENADAAGKGISPLAKVEKSNYRYQMAFSPAEKWNLKSRIEISHYGKENTADEYGFMAFQDIIFKPAPQLPSLSLRYALFDTDSYNSRIYTYENDVLYAYSVPALYNKGTRVYFLVRYQFTENLDFWLRFAQTWYAQTTSIGSGLNEITGDTKSELKFQFRWKF